MIKRREGRKEKRKREEKKRQQIENCKQHKKEIVFVKALNKQQMNNSSSSSSSSNHCRNKRRIRITRLVIKKKKANQPKENAFQNKQHLVQSIDFSPCVLPMSIKEQKTDPLYFEQLQKEYRDLSIKVWSTMYLFSIEK